LKKIKTTLINIAKIGKTTGLRGYLRLNLLTDFPQQFKKGVEYQTKIGKLIIDDVTPAMEVKFKNYDTLEDAKKLTNLILQLPKNEAEKLCELKEDEFFWYDIIGLEVYEANQKIGIVTDIERLLAEDHLLIKLSNHKNLKRIIFPFNKKTIGKVDILNKKIEVFGALEMIEVLQ